MESGGAQASALTWYLPVRLASACLQSSAELGRRGRQKPITEAPAHARVTPSRTVMRGRALVGLELFAQARSQAAIGPEPKCASDARGMKDGGFFGGRRWE